MEGAIVVLIVFFSLTVIAGMIAFTRHRERMTMLEKGVSAEDIRALYSHGAFKINPLSSLKWGIVFITVGIAILLGMWLTATFHMEEGVYPGLIALFGGVGLVIFYVIAQKRSLS